MHVESFCILSCLSAQKRAPASSEDEDLPCILLFVRCSYKFKIINALGSCLVSAEVLTSRGEG